MSILTAIVTDVPVGHLTIPGLMDENKEFYVGVPQVVSQFQFDSRQASRDIKTLLDKDFQFDKLKTPLNPKAINALPLDYYESLVFELVLKGNPAAIAFSRSLIGLSLRQLFSDAFNVKFEKDDRQQWLKDRQEGKQVRHSLTDAIKWYVDNHEVSEKKRTWIYHHCSEAANLGLFGRKASKLRIDFNVADNSKLRDSLTGEELRWLTEIEDLAARLIIFQGWEPHPAVKEAIERLAINKVDRVA